MTKAYSLEVGVGEGVNHGGWTARPVDVVIPDGYNGIEVVLPKPPAASPPWLDTSSPGLGGQVSAGDSGVTILNPVDTGELLSCTIPSFDSDYQWVVWAPVSAWSGSALGMADQWIDAKKIHASCFKKDSGLKQCEVSIYLNRTAINAWNAAWDVMVRRDSNYDEAGEIYRAPTSIYRKQGISSAPVRREAFTTLKDLPFDVLEDDALFQGTGFTSADYYVRGFNYVCGLLCHTQPDGRLIIRGELTHNSGSVHPSDPSPIYIFNVDGSTEVRGYPDDAAWDREVPSPWGGPGLPDMLARDMDLIYGHVWSLFGHSTFRPAGYGAAVIEPDEPSAYNPDAPYDPALYSFLHPIIIYTLDEITAQNTPDSELNFNELATTTLEVQVSELHEIYQGDLKPYKNSKGLKATLHGGAAIPLTYRGGDDGIHLTQLADGRFFVDYDLHGDLTEITRLWWDAEGRALAPELFNGLPDDYFSGDFSSHQPDGVITEVDGTDLGNSGIIVIVPDDISGDPEQIIKDIIDQIPPPASAKLPAIQCVEGTPRTKDAVIIDGYELPAGSSIDELMQFYDREGLSEFSPEFKATDNQVFIKDDYGIWRPAYSFAVNVSECAEYLTAPDPDEGSSCQCKSLYQIWLDAGNEGSEHDFLASLRGQSAYELWLDDGNEGTLQDFFSSLKGESIQGDPGASAYEIWLAAGNEGSEQDFLESLKATPPAGKRTTDLPLADSIQGSEKFMLVQGGASKAATVAQLRDYFSE